MVAWFWLACAGIAGLVAGFVCGTRFGLGLMQPTVQEPGHNLAQDRNFVLSVLRRELANWMIRRDPDRYFRIYKGALEAAAAISAATRTDQRAQLAKLTEQYPFYRNFDLVAVRDYVLYADAMSTNSYDDVERQYTDIIRFQALKIALDEAWSGYRVAKDDEMVHLEEYVQKFKDTRLKNRLKAAIDEFYVYARGSGTVLDVELGAKGSLYETATLSLNRVHHFAEQRYGVHFKDTDEFCLYCFFVHDSRKISYSFYRCDANFENEILLDDMWLDESLCSSASTQSSPLHKRRSLAGC
jgi:hypothetical protein